MSTVDTIYEQGSKDMNATQRAEKERRLAELEAAFAAAGGRGVEQADEMDELRQDLRSVEYEVLLAVRVDPEELGGHVATPDKWNWVELTGADCGVISMRRLTPTEAEPPTPIVIASPEDAAIEAMLRRKQAGTDCTEDESAAVKAYFDRHPEDSSEVVGAFPLEWDDWNGEKAAGYR